jgi:hypothetical protein
MSRNKISESIQQQVRSRAIGRATVAALLLNRDQVIPIRAANREIGRHPPIDDPIQTSD